MIFFSIETLIEEIKPVLTEKLFLKNDVIQNYKPSVRFRTSRL